MPVATAAATSVPGFTAGARARKLKALTVVAIVLLLVVCTIGIMVPAGLGWDFANFYDAGRRVAAGQVQDLYSADRPIAGMSPQGQMRFWSAPLAAVFLMPLAWFEPSTALVVFKVQNTVVLLLALVLLYRRCERVVTAADRSMFAFTFAAMSALYQPFWTIYRVGGQTTPTVFLLLIIALLVHERGRLMTSAILLVIVAIIKPTFMTMLLFLALVSGLTFTLRLVLAGAAAGLLSIAMLGWPIHEEFLKVLVEGSRMSRPWIYNSSLYVPFENFRLLTTTTRASAQILMTMEWILRAAVAGTFVVLIRRSHRHTWDVPARRHFEFLMAICFWLLVSPLVWEHYLTALFLPLGYFVAIGPVMSSRARRLVGAIFALALWQNLILVQYVASHLRIESTAALALAGLLKAGPLILLLLLLWNHHQELFASYRTPVWNRQEDTL